MYKNLCAEALGINGRQSEVIELALTHGFAGIDIDFESFIALVESRGLDQATRYLKSARLKVGPLELSLPLDDDDVRFVPALKDLPRQLEAAKEIEADLFYLTISSGNDSRPYHENFELHRTRLAQICEELAKFDMRLALDFVAPVSENSGQYQFISEPEALITLVKTTDADNLGLLIDLWKWRIAGGTIDQLRSLDLARILSVRVADIPDGVDINTIDSTQRALPNNDSTFVRDAFALLADGAYGGPVTIYPHPSQLDGGKRDQHVVTASKLIEKLRAGEPLAASSSGESVATKEEDKTVTAASAS